MTTALFERHFIDADPSLKATLNVQYRMHSTIMDTINEFYGGQLKAGLNEREKALKQHGFIIKKKDDFGSKFGVDSHLIYPERAVYWLDSAFDRKGKYCEEVQDFTSKVNPREIDLGIKLLDEFNEQVGLWKTEVNNREGWATHVHLRHLVKEKMPVAFIATYAAQKRTFDRQAFGGGDNTTEERWPHLDVKVDTVDRFQGGERPVVIVSLVNSNPVGKEKKQIERLLKKRGEPKADWLTNGRQSTKNTVAIRPPRSMFAKSPNRVNVAFSRAQNCSSFSAIVGDGGGRKSRSSAMKKTSTDETLFRAYGILMNCRTNYEEVSSMGVNCSESGLKAMSDVVKNDGLAVIHTVDGIWKVKHYPVAVVHARQRPLSLLERFVLKALIQVQGCTVEDLVAQFGLERNLVESTLRVIKHCNLIELEDVVGEDDERRAARSMLEAELKTILETLAHSSGTEDYQEERRDLEAKKLVLQDQIRGMDREIKELITQQGHRQRYSVSTAGKEAHANGFLKEPVERKTYSFVRCMTSGQLFMLGNENLPSNALEEDWVREPELNQPDWMNMVSEHHASSLPNQSEVENALSEAYPNDTIEINSIELLGEKYLDSEAHIPIHLTFACASFPAVLTEYRCR